MKTYKLKGQKWPILVTGQYPYLSKDHDEYQYPSSIDISRKEAADILREYHRKKKNTHETLRK